MSPASRRTLVLGGTRSGKSAYAENLLPAKLPVRYLATARTDPTDAEWTARIATHQARRPAGWVTIESTDTPVELLRPDPDALLVDDLATWLTGAMDDSGSWTDDPSAPGILAGRTDALVRAVEHCPSRLVLVSAEVGLGVVPETRSGRLFRDELGALNARLAQVCDEVVLLVAGIPLKLR